MPRKRLQPRDYGQKVTIDGVLVGQPKKKPTPKQRKVKYFDLAVGEKMQPDQVLDMKSRVLKLLAAGVDSEGNEILTPTDAAVALGLQPFRVYQWLRSDPDFKEYVDLARQVTADKLEGELARYPNFIPKMMILKGIRPMYRENYTPRGDDTQLTKLITDLQAFATAPQAQKIESAPTLLPPLAQLAPVEEKNDHPNGN